MDNGSQVREIIKKNLRKKGYRRIEKIMPVLFFTGAMISVITTIAIVSILLLDAVRFFETVPFMEIFSTKLAPLAKDPSFGMLPILTGTVITSVIAMMVAVPAGLVAAIYISEFASSRRRKLIKPLLELLAGIPTIVYGFFAYNFVTPLLMKLIPGLEAKNALSPGIVMGIMIIPIVASISEDAMNSVPDALREGAFALGSTKLETSFKVVIPAAISGIIASFVLAVSRAIGETMIVTIASGSSKQFTFDITKSMQTMTSYIVEFTSGDAGAGTTGYYSLYAVGLLLFVFTMIMNLAANYIIRRFREVY